MSGQAYGSVEVIDLTEDARKVAQRWVWFLVLGLLVMSVAVALLLNLRAAATTVAILVGIGLVLGGIDDLVNAHRFRVAFWGYALGALSIVTGVLAMVWPDVTLWALALVVGIGFLVHGVVEVAGVLRAHESLPGRGLWLVIGVLSIVVGLMCLAWPEATVAVLAILFALRLLFQGAMMVAFALGLRQVGGGLRPAG